MQESRAEGGAMAGGIPDQFMPAQEERTWALVAHAGAPIGVLASAGLLGFAIPLFILLARQRESEFVGDQAKEALNFQITVLLIHLGGLLAILLTLGLSSVVVVPILFLVWVAELVLGIIAALRAYGGQRYRYPFALRLLT